MRPSRIRDMLFKQLTLVFIPKALLKTGPPSLGILYIETDKGNLDASGLYASDIDYMYTDYKKNLHVRPSRIRDIVLFLLKARLKTGRPNVFFLGGSGINIIQRNNL